MPEKSTFHPVDFVVFLGVIGFSLGVGGYYAFVDRKKQSAQEYLMGGRKMPILPVTLSLLASFLSAIALLGACEVNFGIFAFSKSFESFVSEI